MRRAPINRFIGSNPFLENFFPFQCFYECVFEHRLTSIYCNFQFRAFEILFIVSNVKRLKMAKVEPAPSAAFPAGGALNASVRNKATVRT